MCVFSLHIQNNCWNYLCLTGFPFAWRIQSPSHRCLRNRQRRPLIFFFARTTGRCAWQPKGGFPCLDRPIASSSLGALPLAPSLFAAWTGYSPRTCRASVKGVYTCTRELPKSPDKNLPAIVSVGDGSLISRWHIFKSMCPPPATAEQVSEKN